MSEMPVTAVEDRQWSMLFELLQNRAAESPGRGFYVRDGRGAQDFRTLSQLLASAHRIAYALAERGVVAGDRVLVAQPTGFDFLSTFFGLQALGAVAVPVGWSDERDLLRGWSQLARWRRMAIRYGARVLICGDLGSRGSRGLMGIWPPHPLEFVTDVDQLLQGVPGRVEVEPHRARGGNVAYIQSSSGTTGSPRGVKLTHRGIYTSVEAIGRRIQVDDKDVLVSWLPLDNIMGLVGVVCFALHWGIRPVLMHPERFLERPEDWFWAISEHRATFSLAPNFAFNYCVRRCNASALEGLDLSSWRIAMNGSEPVRAQHMQAFARRFHRYGLDDHIIMPVYGLSEATLGVTSHPPREPLRIDGINRRDLERKGRATPLPPQGADTPSERMHVVSVGGSLDGIELRVVDEDREPVAERVLGEVAVRGPNLMAGYVAATIRAEDPAPTRIDDDGWLLTGDLGYMADGDLFLISRHSDCIVLDDGRRIFPEEVEFFVDAVDGVRAGSTAVFSLADEISDGEVDRSIIVAFEVQAGADGDELHATIHTVLKSHLDLEDIRLVDLPPRSVPKTTTGKVRRHHCRRLMKQGLLGERSAGALHPANLNRSLRDIGETLQGSGASIVDRLTGWISQD